MKTNWQKLSDFHLALDGELLEKPTVPSAEIINLRRTLIREEYEEVLEAFDALEGAKEGALAHLMHECSDLLYVVYGTMVACGVDGDAVFDEVHRANMQKANGPRRADGKVLKPADFRPANVAAVLEKLQNGS